MVEFLAEGTNQICGVLTVGGFDEMIMVLAVCGHTARNCLELSKNRNTRFFPRNRVVVVKSISNEKVGEFVVENEKKAASSSSQFRAYRIAGAGARLDGSLCPDPQTSLVSPLTCYCIKVTQHSPLFTIYLS